MIRISLLCGIYQIVMFAGSCTIDTIRVHGTWDATTTRTSNSSGAVLVIHRPMIQSDTVATGKRQQQNQAYKMHHRR